LQEAGKNQETNPQNQKQLILQLCNKVNFIQDSLTQQKQNCLNSTASQALSSFPNHFESLVRNDQQTSFYEKKPGSNQNISSYNSRSPDQIKRMMQEYLQQK
jgi:hypothetical protein